MVQPIIKLEWEAASQLLHESQNIIIVTHVHPDGDAIGSLCGLGLALREQGRQVTMAVDDGVNDYLSFIPGSDTVVTSLDDARADLVIGCDASDLARLGELGAAAFALATPTIVLDHHATNSLFGAVHIVHENYVSTTEAVLRWLDHLGWEPSLHVATALMVGYVTDTISFRVGPVTAETLHQVARLMNYGVDLRGVIERMLIRVEPGQLQLMGRGLSNLLIEDHVAWTYLTLRDFRELNLITTEKPELSTEILRDAAAYIACFFLETEEGDVRLSLRAKPGFDIGSIAHQLGGGGHTLAAGATIEHTTIDEAIQSVIPLLKAEARRGSPRY